MKFLLVAVNAKYIHSNPAVYSLAAYAQKLDASLGEHIEIGEYTINHQIGDILADIYQKKPDVIGFSCYIWNITYIRELICELPKLLPKVQIWLGGPEVSYGASQYLTQYPALAGIMLGEGEQTFYDLLIRYVSPKKESEEEMGLTKAELETVPGLAIRREDEIIYTPPRQLTDLTEIPFLYYDLTQFENKIIYYESSRGCPFRCSYCLSSIDKTVRLRDLEVVKKELKFFLDSKVSQVKFVDRTFNCNKKHALAIWKYLLEHDNGVTNFHFEVAADILDEEELIVLNQFRPGAVQLEIGVQSTNPDTIREIDRRMDVDVLRRVVSRIHEGHNVHMHLDLIAGLPYEDYDSFGRSFDDVYAMRPEQLQLGFLKVLMGSKMHDKSQEYGISYLDRPPYEVLYTDWISYDEICKLKQIEEMVEIYYNSNQFRTTMRLLETCYDSAFAMFEMIAQYYEKKGYFIQSPARSYRYQVLYDFFMEEAFHAAEKKGLGITKELIAECLTMDLYLRENMKTRPAFCRDLSIYKEETRAFYQMEAKDHAYLPHDPYDQADARTLAKMTHIEVFDHDLEHFHVLDKPVYVLFDYLMRDPLTYDATRHVVLQTKV